MLSFPLYLTFTLIRKRIFQFSTHFAHSPAAAAIGVDFPLNAKCRWLFSECLQWRKLSEKASGVKMPAIWQRLKMKSRLQLRLWQSGWTSLSVDTL